MSDSAQPTAKEVSLLSVLRHHPAPHHFLRAPAGSLTLTRTSPWGPRVLGPACYDAFRPLGHGRDAAASYFSGLGTLQTAKALLPLPLS